MNRNKGIHGMLGKKGFSSVDKEEDICLRQLNDKEDLGADHTPRKPGRLNALTVVGTG